MEFNTFEEALQICVTSENGSPEQDAALRYCLEHAPQDLRQMLMDHYHKLHGGHGDGCACGGHDEH